MDRALDILNATPPDVFNHNWRNVPRIYRGGSSGRRLQLVAEITGTLPKRTGKFRPSGLMVGLGETNGIVRLACATYAVMASPC